MLLNLTADEVKALKGLIEYDIEDGLFDFLAPEDQADKNRIMNILNLLKG